MTYRELAVIASRIATFGETANDYFRTLDELEVISTIKNEDQEERQYRLELEDKRDFLGALLRNSRLHIQSDMIEIDSFFGNQNIQLALDLVAKINRTLDAMKESV